MSLSSSRAYNRIPTTIGLRGSTLYRCISGFGKSNLFWPVSTADYYFLESLHPISNLESNKIKQRYIGGLRKRKINLTLLVTSRREEGSITKMHVGKNSGYSMTNHALSKLKSFPRRGTLLHVSPTLAPWSTHVHYNCGMSRHSAWLPVIPLCLLNEPRQMQIREKFSWAGLETFYWVQNLSQKRTLVRLPSMT